MNPPFSHWLVGEGSRIDFFDVFCLWKGGFHKAGVIFHYPILEDQTMQMLEVSLRTFPYSPLFWVCNIMTPVRGGIMTRCHDTPLRLPPLLDSKIPAACLWINRVAGKGLLGEILGACSRPLSVMELQWIICSHRRIKQCYSLEN